MKKGIFMIKKIDHMNIVVSNFEESVSFFKSLNFHLLDEATLEGEWISSVVNLPNVKAKYAKMSLENDSACVELIQYLTPRSGKDPQTSQANQMGYRHMALNVENIEEVVEKIKEQGRKFLSPIVEYKRTGKKIVYFLGPDGIIMELAQYPTSK